MTKKGLQYLIVSLAALAIGSVSSAEVAKDSRSWLKDPISGCDVWNSKPQADVQESISWSGASDVDGKASGKGVLVWLSDGKIAGRFEGGKAQSRGVAYFSSGDGFARDVAVLGLKKLKTTLQLASERRKL